MSWASEKETGLHVLGMCVGKLAPRKLFLVATGSFPEGWIFHPN
jgi:hypothetical protein